ncbi:hypothetical protein N7471_013231 [Penicillium samsonianum]|uniref:uncharacterized protein n=1 Tax=Penicillium samsonianum TaxID=1882272 RepID=UPI0025473B9F|nr:uncharacterized protein N7471_013231 [Penicillium samsonianum]KAJ6118611.1 hypothetical protein N7471_013231 [Penicillium samsonianum]
MKGTLILSGLLATTVSAHMQLSKPLPIRSPLNKDAKGQKDYSYTNPLSTSGSDYPCKGYANDDFEAVATWEPGSSQEMELEGSAVHDGGSCQLALTYDQGKTFKVIESVEGDCPIAKKYQFDIPSDAPSGDALFAWTWFNKVGNREMYMNCAMITIGGSGNRTATGGPPKQLLQEKTIEKGPNNKANDQTPYNKPNSHTTSAENSFDSLPEIFVANVDQTGKCVTIEGQAVHFPKPGSKLIGKADGPGYKCSGSAPFLDDTSKSEEKPSTTTTKSEKKPATTSASSTTTTTKSEKKPVTTSASSTTTTKSEKRPVTTSSSSTTTTKSEKKPVTTSASFTTTKAMSKVAQDLSTSSTTTDPRVLSTEASSNNQFVDYVGQWSCHSGEIICSPDGFSFAMCTNGKPIFMGAVAAGTICRMGVITARQ